MKKLLLILLLTFLPMSGVWSQEIIVSWDANIENDLAGYKVYIVVDVGDSINYFIDYLPYGKYQFTVSAYDTAGNESELPNKINHEIVNCNRCHIKKESKGEK